MRMKSLTSSLLSLLLCGAMIGCTDNAETVDEGVGADDGLPRVETSGEPTDLDPTTDDDVDIDTPIEGDS